MICYLARRTAVLVATLAVAMTGLFWLLHAGPGSPVDNLGPAVAADPQTRAAVIEAQGLDRSVAEQYLAYLRGLAHGDLGTSLYDGSPVSGAIGSAAPVSAELGILAIAFAVVPAVAAGTWAARRRGSLADGGVRLSTLLAISVPSYWLAVLCLVLVGQRFAGLLPSAGGYVALTRDPAANLKAMALPAIIVGLAAFAMVARAVRTAMAAALDQDDVAFARASGLGEARVVRKVAARRAAPPVLAVAGLVAGGLLTGTVLVESVFALPGLGGLMVDAFVRDDYPVALGAALVTAAVLLVVNLVVDVAIHVVDPRTRTGAAWS